MTVWIALLRAVNVGGTGKLPMRDLRSMCEASGFARVETYIASGNVVFESDKDEQQVRDALERRLLAYAGKPMTVVMRTAAELATVLAESPFPDAAPNRTLAIFLEQPPAADALATVSGQRDEDVHLGRREIYVHYGDAMGTSKLKIPAAARGTARNMNTVAKLVAIASRRGETGRGTP